MLLGVHHVGYLVKHLDRAIDSFKSLGFFLSGAITHDERRQVDIAFLENGSYRIELVSPYAKESVVYRLLSVYGNAPYHLCYLSDNLQKDAEELSHDGFLVFDPESPAPALENRNVVFLVSSKIGIIELLEKQQ